MNGADGVFGSFAVFMIGCTLMHAMPGILSTSLHLNTQPVGTQGTTALARMNLAGVWGHPTRCQTCTQHGYLFLHTHIAPMLRMRPICCWCGQGEGTNPGSWAGGTKTGAWQHTCCHPVHGMAPIPRRTNHLGVQHWQCATVPPNTVAMGAYEASGQRPTNGLTPN